MAGVPREISCPPDRLEVDVVVAFTADAEPCFDGPAGLLNRRLGYPLGQGEGGLSAQLVRGNHKVAAHWVLFYADPEPWKNPDGEKDRLLRQVLNICRKAGFGRVAVAIPELPGCNRSAWQASLACAADDAGLGECLLTFDSSYLHEHSGPVFQG